MQLVSGLVDSLQKVNMAWKGPGRTKGCDVGKGPVALRWQSTSQILL